MADCGADVLSCHYYAISALKIEVDHGMYVTTFPMICLYTYPSTLVMRAQVCDYCTAKCERHVRTIDRLLGIMACEEHLPLATRDVRAWFAQQKMVSQKDFLEIHPILKDISIRVPRTDGSMTPGGNISLEPFEVLYLLDGDWRVRVLFTLPDGKIMHKAMKLIDLEMSGVPAEELSKWINTLETLYQPDLDAFRQAVKLGTEVKPKEDSRVKTVMANGLECRVFIP